MSQIKKSSTKQKTKIYRRWKSFNVKQRWNLYSNILHFQESLDTYSTHLQPFSTIDMFPDANYELHS